MDKKKLALLLANLLKKKFIIPAAILITIAAVGMLAIKFSLDYKFMIDSSVLGTEDTNEQLTINPKLDLDLELLNCAVDPKSISANIVSPKNNSIFLTSSEIQFEGSYKYTCSDKPDFVFAWFLEGRDEPISETLKAILKNLKPGNYTAKFSASSGVVKSKVKVDFKVNEPNKPTPIVPVNKKPTVNITAPNDGDTIYADQSEGRGSNYFATITFEGNAVDPEDGQLKEDSLEWYYEMNGGAKVFMGSREILTMDLYSPKCYGESTFNTYKITLKAKDNKGLYSEKSITIKIDNSYRCYS